MLMKNIKAKSWRFNVRKDYRKGGDEMEKKLERMETVSFFQEPWQCEGRVKCVSANCGKLLYDSFCQKVLSTIMHINL